jgi:hypothetical protein
MAQEQSQANVKTAIAQSYLNNVNQSTPYGSLKYTPDYSGGMIVDGYGIPTWTATQTLTPAGQRLQDTQMSINQGTADLANSYVGRIADATAKPYSYDNLPAAPVYNEQYRQSQLNNIIARNQPQMDRDRAALEQRLADQGIGINDPAYQNAFRTYNTGVNDFRLGADLQAGQEASNMYNLEGNTRDRAISEMTNLRTQPINEVAALLGTGTGVQNPQFVNTPQTQIAPTDVIGAYNSAQQAQLAQQQMAAQQNAATTGGLFGLGGSLLGGAARFLPLGSGAIPGWAPGRAY